MRYGFVIDHTWDARTPDTVKILTGRDDLTEGQKRKVLGDNAARVFRL